MKNTQVWLGMFVVLVFGLVVGGCASAPAAGIELFPSDSQAVVTVVRGPNVGAPGFQGAAANWVIFIDGVEAGRVGNLGTTRFLADNGQRSIQIFWMNVKSDIVEFTVDSNEIIFDVQAVWRGNNLPVLELRSR